MTMGALSHNSKKWDDRFYVKAYQLACAGMENEGIARAIGVKSTTLANWAKERPALAEALSQAREKGAGTRRFMRMVSQRVPDELKGLWEELSDDDYDRRMKAYRTVKEADRKTAQHLFVHAYITMNFNESKAMDMTGVHMQTVAQWKRNDRHFKALLAHIKECRKEFCENALMEKIHEGDTAAIIFANKTLNKDRGYDTRINIEVSGEVEHKNTIDLKKLPPEKLRELLEFARGQKTVAQVENKSATVDAEFEVREKA